MKKKIFKHKYFWFLTIFFIVFFILFYFKADFLSSEMTYENIQEIFTTEEESKIPAVLPLDKVAYDQKLKELANNPPDKIIYETIKKTEIDENGKSITKTEKVPVFPQPVVNHLWPVKTVYPNNGAILPFNRIIAYYGNLYSRNMGVLGQYDEEEMITRLNIEVEKWNKADPTTPVIPALHYIAVVAQGTAGKDGKYRTRMPFSEIDKVIKMAEKIPARPRQLTHNSEGGLAQNDLGAGEKALVFLDIQVGFSDLQTEVPLLEKYLKMPQVHLGIDPEFSMKGTIRPGKVVGTLDASDINFTIDYLAKIVKENNLTPKILVIHRYTQKMVTNYKQIKTTPEVQVVMHMDGWGEKIKKIGTYRQFIYKEPVQFTGFKIFYKNDVFTPGTSIFNPEELLKLNPIPSYIQYQ